MAPNYPALLCNGFCCYLKLMDCLFTCSVLHHILKSVSFLVFHSLKQAIKKLEYACPWVQNSFQWKNEVPDPPIDAARSMFPFASVSSRASKKKETLISSINVRPSWHARIKLRTHTLVSSDRLSRWRTRWHCQELLESISNLVRTLVIQGTHRHSTVNSWYTATSICPPASKVNTNGIWSMFEQSKFGAWDHQDKIQLLRSHNSSRKSEYTCRSSCEPVSYQGGNVWGQEISGHKKKDIYIFLSFYLFLFILLKK